jgi:FkbM family methyltransferase
MKSPLKELERKCEVLRRQQGFRLAPVRTGTRLISWRVRSFLGKAAIVDFPRWHVQMYLPAIWRGIGKFMFVFRENYEPELNYLGKFLSAGKIFIDVGAAFGIYTLVASKLVGKSGRVIALEPTAQSFVVLRRNIALNGLTNVLALPLAASLMKGKARLYHGPEPGSNSLGKDASSGGGCEEVHTECLDRLMQQAGVEHVDLIKMDVEGAEELVLRGANRVVTSMHPAIIFEVYPVAAARLGLSATGAWEMLAAWGYEFFVVGRGGTISPIKSPPASGNVLAIYGEQKGKSRARTKPMPSIQKTVS